MNRLCAIAVLLVAGGLTACQSPVHISPRNDAAGTVRISLAPQSRTVTADWAALVDTYEVTLSALVGEELVQLSQSVPAAQSGAIVFTDVVPGTWSISVDAYQGERLIGWGSLDNQVVTAAGSLSATVTMTVAAEQTVIGNGAFSLRVAVPASVGVDYLFYRLFPWGATQAGAVPLGMTLNGDTYEATIAQSGLAGGRYRLELRFLRGGFEGTLAGIYSEAVNIWDGITSDRWLSPGGTLLPVRTFLASDFNSANANLGNLVVRNQGGTEMALTPGFSSGTTTYNLAVSGTTSEVRLSMTPSMGGQKLQVILDGQEEWTTVSSTTAYVVPISATSQSIQIRVTANDQSATQTYQINLTSQADITFGWGPYQSLVFSPAAFALNYGQAVQIAPGSGFSGASAWRWYVNGVLQSSLNGQSAFTMTPDAPGTYHIGVTVLAQGVLYSGSVVVTVRAPLTVSYHGNGATGGSAPVDPQGYGSGQNVVVLANPGGLVRSGYILTGWNTAADGSGTNYPMGSSLPMGSSGVVLYAVWVSEALLTITGTELTAVSTSLTGRLMIPEGIKSIGPSALQGCSGLSDVSLPNSLEVIGGAAFKACTGLTSITFPPGVTEIGGEVFMYCTGLVVAVCLPTTPPSIVGSSPFYGVPSVFYVSVPGSLLATYTGNTAWNELPGDIIPFD